MEQVNDPEDINSDLYDEVGTLEKWQDTLSDMLSSGNLTHEDFEIEMFKTRYYLDIKTKTFVLTEEDKEILNKVKKMKEEVIKKYKNGRLDENEFNVSYVFYLRKEYDILKRGTVYDKKDPESVDIDVDMPLKDKLEKMQEAETKYIKSIAKKRGIYMPKLPKGYSQKDIDDYYARGSTDNETINKYIKEWNTAKNKVEFYTSSFEVSKLMYDSKSGKTKYEFKTVAPLSDKIENIKKIERRGNLLTPEEQMYSDRLNNLKSRLRMMTKEDLLKCAGASTVKHMSYIERLKMNKQKVLRFREHPENYQDLVKIIGEENQKYYRIPSDKLFKTYKYSLPDTILDEENIMYTEKGNIGYLAIKKGSNLNDLGYDLSNFETVLPIEDPLYAELNSKNGDKTELSEVWELRGSLPGSKLKDIVKRYLSFEDYITDLKEILIQNSKKLTGASRDSLLNKIRKINYYLEHSEDIEEYNLNGHISISKLFENRSNIYEQRKKGLYKLLQYFTQYYPGSKNIIEKIEDDIFNYSSLNYDYNIDKVFYLIDNHQHKIEDLIEGNESIINLLTYETPYVIPKEDVKISGDKQENINYLLSWRPETSNFDKYKTELESYDYNFNTFKKNHPEIQNLMIENIMQEYLESIMWEKSLKKYINLEVPDGYIELNYRLRFLLRQRNRLPSRRIYRIATVDQRITAQNNLKLTFDKCNVKFPNVFAIPTENVIYEYSKSREDYIYYNKLINDEYRKLCNFFNVVNSDFSNLTDNYSISNVITEFLITQGELETVDIPRLKRLLEDLKLEDFDKYIYKLRGKEIEVFNRNLLENKNNNKSIEIDYVKAIRIVKSAAFKNKLENLRNIAANTYKPPVISEEKPSSSIFGKYPQKYIYTGEYYVYGGNYPLFHTYDDNGNVLKDNYTRADLEKLAGIFKLELQDDTFALWKSIMNYINDYDKKETRVEIVDYTPIDYNYYEYLKLPSKTIHYTVRPRIGVKSPGYAYSVTKDPYKTFGVPYDFDENTIPIYDTSLKQRVDDGFIIIEGPCIFKGNNPEFAVVSDSYIILQYNDSRGKTVNFREGVSNKKIIQRKLEELDTCGRFLDQISCDDPNSHSLDVFGLKYKCKWLNKKCKGVPFITETLDKFDINLVNFKDYNRNILWKNAKEKAIKFIENLLRIKELTPDEIQTLTRDQKQKLYEYYNKLNVKREKLSIIVEEKEEAKNYLQIDPELMSIISKVQPEYIPKRTLNDEYETFTIYSPKITNRNLPLSTIILGKEYNVNGNIVIPQETTTENEDGKLMYICKVKDTDETLILETNEFRRKSNTLTTVTESINCYISKEDYKLLNNYRGYYWYNSVNVYNRKPGEITKTEDLVKMYNVHGSFIKLSEPIQVVNGKPLIKKNDVMNAMISSAFSTFSTEDEIFYNNINKVNATEDAIRSALLYNIDINQMYKTVIGTITTKHVLDEIDKNAEKFQVLTKEELENKLRNAISKNDKDEIFRYITSAKQLGVSAETLKEALRLLKEIPDKKQIPEKTKKEKEIEPKSSSKSNIYVAKRRR